jgi:hypothetical protein
VAVNKFQLYSRLLFRLPFQAIFGFPFWRHFRRLRYPTNLVIRHFIAGCSAEDAIKLDAQLAQPFYQQWWLKGRINPIFYYALDPETLLESPEYQESLFRVEMRVDGKKLFTNIEFSRGRLYSVQLPRPILFFKDKEIILGVVTHGTLKQSYTRAIDRVEHDQNTKA